MDLLERFDAQLRTAVTDDDGIFSDHGWNAVLSVPPDVERTVGRLRALSGYREWKLYSHDPAGLAEQLRAFGLEPEDEETVMVAEAASLAPTAFDVRVAATPELIDAFDEIAVGAFGEGSPGIKAELLRALEQEPRPMLAVLSYEDGVPVASGRIDFSPNADFAGFFGGATLPEHRGRGHYRATVAKRAELARERGYRWIYVDALPTSRPILERLGLTQLTTTTPWVFSRDPAASSSG
jgi:GNAT superfamily N-acetyltransferase